MTTTPRLTAWDLFVLRHTKPGNLAVHGVSFLLYFGSPVLALWASNPWFLLGVPLSGLVGAAGHFAFRDGGVKVSEATYDPKVPLFVTIMFFKLFTGRYWADVETARARYHALLRGERGAS